MSVVFKFSPFKCLDIPLLFKWLSLKHVAEWWREELDYDFIYKKYNKWLESEDVGQYLICDDQKPIGYIQWYQASDLPSREKKLPKKTYGFDIFIADLNYLGKGYGSLIIKKFLNEIILLMDPEKIIVDPEISNHRAIHVYEKVGFKKTAIIDATDGSKLVKAQLMEFNVKFVS